MRWFLISAIAVLLGGYGAFAFFGNRAGADDDQEDSFAVVVANRYIPAFSAVTAAQAVVRRFPKEYAPPGALSDLSELSDDKGLAAYGSAVAIPEGQPLTRSLLGRLGQRHEMASLLPPGQVAVSFSVDPVRGVGGWIQPGDAIAIFEIQDDLSGRAPGRRQTRLLFSSVRVLAVDRRRIGAPVKETAHEEMASEPADGNVLTVVLNPVEAARLVEVRERGQISALLRPLGDETPWTLSERVGHE